MVSTQRMHGSDYISRDLSWLCFNERVLAQVRKKSYTFAQRLRFLAIVSHNSDEFFMIRVGSLYNYIDYDKPRLDYSGLSTLDFKRHLLRSYQQFAYKQHSYFSEEMLPLFDEYPLHICVYNKLSKRLQSSCEDYFQRVVYPMLTPMVYDGFHSFPILTNHVLTFAVRSEESQIEGTQKLSFLQIPKNIPRFHKLIKGEKTIYVPIESIVRARIQTFFKNVDIQSISFFRLTRNGDFTLDDLEDIEANFLDELKAKLRNRRTGRVVRIEVEKGYDAALFTTLCQHWQVEKENIIEISPPALLDLTALEQILRDERLSMYHSAAPVPITPLTLWKHSEISLLTLLKEQDVLLHHPYNSINLLIRFIEQAADDPHVLIH